MPIITGGAHQSVTVIRRTVRYSDFGPPVDDNSFVSVHTFAVGDIALGLYFICTQTFNDSGAGSLAFQMTDPDNGFALAALTSGGVANPGQDGIIPLTVLGDGPSPWITAAEVTPPGYVVSPVTAGLSDNGRMNRDGSAGAFSVFIFYIPAP